MVVGSTSAGHLYSCLIPLVLLLVDGNSLACLDCCALIFDSIASGFNGDIFGIR